MAVTKIKTTDFTSALNASHRKLFDQAYYDEATPQYTEVFKVITMGKPSETFVHLGGFGLPESNVEGGTINEDSMSEGDTATLTAVRYDKGYRITYEMLKDDLQGVFGGAGMRGRAVVRNAPMQMGKAFRQNEEVKAAYALTNGFGDTGYDGVSTFSASHPLADNAATKSNLISGALSPATVKEAIELVRTDTVDEANLISVVRPKLLVVAPGSMFTAAEVLGSTLQSGEMSNTPNAIGDIRPFVWDFLTQTGSTYAATNWFVVSHDVDNALFGWNDKTWFDVEKQSGTVDYLAYGYQKFAAGIVNWRGLVGSTGA